MLRQFVFRFLLIVGLAPRVALAFDGRLGVYDDAVHTQEFGTMAPGFKTLYLGVHLDHSSFGGLTSLEFSISGLEAPLYLYDMQIQPTPAVTVGDIHAPADTVMGSGGINIGWSTCLEGGDVSIMLTLVSPAPPADHSIRVFRRFPPSNPNVPPYPVAQPCDIPCSFCPQRLEGRRYVLNPTIGVEGRTWAAVKDLFRYR